MKVLTDSSDLRLAAAVVSIGMFDGVHRGHAKVLHQLRERGRQLGVPTAVVTFNPHPRAILKPDACPMLLSSLEDRLQLLAATGAVDHCLVLHFNHARSQQPADEFVLTTLLNQLGMRELIVGENFACGRSRQGTVAYLSTIARRLGFGVTGVKLDRVPGTVDAVRSSSTEARRLIQSGDLAGASAMLQRPHEMTGTITRALAASRLAVEAALDRAMCTPAAADYVGAVRQRGDASPWVPARLRVRDDRDTGCRMVRLVADGALHVVRGDPLRIRFVDRAQAGRLLSHPEKSAWA